MIIYWPLLLLEERAYLCYLASSLQQELPSIHSISFCRHGRIQQLVNTPVTLISGYVVPWHADTQSVEQVGVRRSKNPSLGLGR